MDLKKPTKQRWLTSLLVIFWSSFATGQIDTILPASLFDYLDSFDSLELRVSSDSKALLRKKDEYQDARIDFHMGETEVLSTDGEIRTRGNARKDICFVPPTKLRFDKGYLKELGFSTYPTLKVVNACSLRNPDQIYVHTEQLAYRLDRLFTDHSFRTIPVKICYTDTQAKRDDMIFHGFIIEHEDQLADRLGGDIYDGSLFKEEMLNREAYLDFCMFQYMIGNTDWKVLNKHNMKILRVLDVKEIHAIAYDFDYSGLVAAHYAVPHETLPIKSVIERVYLGPCMSEIEMMTCRQKFLDKKAEVFKVIADTPGLRERALKKVSFYIEEFYKVLESERTCKKTFADCR